MEVQSINLGDALKKLSNNVQTELQNTLFLMRNQDPELRTTELRAFLSRTRTKLSQMYAMLRWLSSPGISQCFRSINDFNGQLVTMEGEMARNLDEMYFCHASIFSMRSRPLEIIKAKDILARETYYNLPAAMFSCGKPDFPAELDSTAVRRDLTVYLRTKLSLEDISSLPFPIAVTIQDGLLTLECNHYFRLFLTLRTLHERAQWSVLNCLLLNDAANGAPAASAFDKDRTNLERKLVIALREMVSVDSSSPVATEEEGTAAMESKSDQEVISRNVLKELIWECRSTAVRGSVSLLHQQLVTSPQCMSYFKECSQAALVESVSAQGSLNLSIGTKASRNGKSNLEGYYLSLKVWKSSFHGEPQFEVRVSPQAVAPSDATYSDIAVSIHTTLTYRAPTLVFASSSRLFPVPYVGAHLAGQNYIREGCDAGRLVRDVLCLLTEQKLSILMRRVEYTISKLSSDVTKDIRVSRSATGVCIRHARCRSVLQVQVDARNGKYVVDAASLGDVADAERKVIELFGAEINNLDAENYISNLLLKEGVDVNAPAAHAITAGESANPFADIRLDVPLITTLDESLALFDLALYSELVHSAVPDLQGQHGLAPKLLPVLGRLRCRGLVYNLLSWDDFGVHAADTTIASSIKTAPNNNTAAAYASMFPNSHVTLDKATLSKNVNTASSVATKRNVNKKKRVFSESAFNTSVPGDFVSAAALQAEYAAENKVTLPPVKQVREVIALYVVVSVDANKQTALSRVLCRCCVSVTAGVLDPPSTVPVVLQHHTVIIEATNNSSDTTATAASVNAFVAEAKEWVNGLVRTPLSLNRFDFAHVSSTSALTANGTTDSAASEVAKMDLLTHADGGLSAIFADSTELSLSVVGVSADIDCSHLCVSQRDGWKGVINSISGHFCESINLRGFNGIVHCNNTVSGPSGIVYSLALSLFPTIGSKNDDSNAATAASTSDAVDAVTVVCTHASVDSHTHAQYPSQYAAMKVFATHFAESLFRQWLLPPPAISSVKVELLKRVKFVRDVWWLLQVLTEPPRGKNNIQNGENGHLARTEDEEAMDVDDEQADSGPSRYPTQNLQLQPLHFTIKPKPSTNSASGCSVQMVFAVHQHTDNRTTATASSVSIGAYLHVAVAYSSSTMRGMGKSVSTAELCDVTFRHLLGSGEDAFHRSHSVKELSDQQGALLKQLLTDYLTSIS